MTKCAMVGGGFPGTQARTIDRHLATVSLALATCTILCAASENGAATAGVANVGATTTTTSALGTAASPAPFAGPQKEYQYDPSYAAYMRSHGLPEFPDPTLINASNNKGVTFDQHADAKTPQFAAANAACKHLLPDDGGRPTASQLAALAADLLRFSQCMRANGEPHFPDPTVNTHEIGFSLNGTDPNSPQFRRARQHCASLNPIAGD